MYFYSLNCSFPRKRFKFQMSVNFRGFNRHRPLLPSGFRFVRAPGGRVLQSTHRRRIAERKGFRQHFRLHFRLLFVQRDPQQFAPCLHEPHGRQESGGLHGGGGRFQRYRSGGQKVPFVEPSEVGVLRRHLVVGRQPDPRRVGRKRNRNAFQPIGLLLARGSQNGQRSTSGSPVSHRSPSQRPLLVGCQRSLARTPDSKHPGHGQAAVAHLQRQAGRHGPPGGVRTHHAGRHGHSNHQAGAQSTSQRHFGYLFFLFTCL